MGAAPQYVTLELVPLTCGECGITYGMSREFYDAMQRLGPDGRFYCPNGHCRCFRTREVDLVRKEAARVEQQLRQRLQWAEEREEYSRKRARKAERSASAYKGQVTKIKNRVGNGVCPCCNRTFANLARHMQSKHPDFSHEEAPCS